MFDAVPMAEDGEHLVAGGELLRRQQRLLRM
jgi:hypothetical protein